MTIITADHIADLVAQALAGATVAGATIYSPRTWPDRPTDGPRLFVQTPTERKENQAGRTGPAEFYASCVVRIIGRLTALPTEDLDASAAAMQGALAVFQRQIEVAVINADALRRAVQQFVSADVTTATKTEGAGVEGQVVVSLTLEFYQGPDAFAPLDGDTVAEMAIYADLINVFSAADTFDGLEPFDAATAAPRTAGPDGRPEATQLIDLS